MTIQDFIKHEIIFICNRPIHYMKELLWLLINAFVPQVDARDSVAAIASFATFYGSDFLSSMNLQDQ